MSTEIINGSFVEVFRSDAGFMGAIDLLGRGVSEATMTIADVKRHKNEKLCGKDVGEFASIGLLKKDGTEFEQRLKLNKTNYKTLVSLFGAKAAGWAGKQITLYLDTTNFGSKKDVACIRIKGAT